VLARPGGDEAALADALVQNGAQGKVRVMRAQDAGLPVAADLGSALADCWPVDEVRRAYRQFQRTHLPLLEALQALTPTTINAADAFCARTLLVHAYRRVQLHDPQLPLSLLGEDWPAQAAYQLSRDIYGKVTRSAEKHITSTLAAEEGDAPVLAPTFTKRFA
jgi:phenylacetic acid degradation operon negative regulatory protein